MEFHGYRKDLTPSYIDIEVDYMDLVTGASSPVIEEVRRITSADA
jgi:hypothetical protein